ncbi:MAG: GDYXXLXY domain-containing protein [Kiritimatiellae bacterium]|nr:GDYXXLXY domain-containing protein [Kiritimatiellia bacterium]
MKRSVLFAIFICVAVIQLLLPVVMIARRENVLKTGQPFKLQTAPVDPYDAFRGRYVALRYDLRSTPLAHGHTFENAQTVYAVLEGDAEGFGKITSLHHKRPDTDTSLKLQLNSVTPVEARFSLPFDRFYMDEFEAPEAERVYWQNARRTNRTAYVQIRVKNGLGVIEELYVQDMPIRKFISYIATKK